MDVCHYLSAALPLPTPRGSQVARAAAAAAAAVMAMVPTRLAHTRPQSPGLLEDDSPLSSKPAEAAQGRCLWFLMEHLRHFSAYAGRLRSKQRAAWEVAACPLRYQYTTDHASLPWLIDAALVSFFLAPVSCWRAKGEVSPGLGAGLAGLGCVLPRGSGCRCLYRRFRRYRRCSRPRHRCRRRCRLSTRPFCPLHRFWCRGTSAPPLFAVPGC